MDAIFQRLVAAIEEQQVIINRLATKIEQIEHIGGGGGGGGTASIEDYESGKIYKRNTMLVDPNTETVYRVLREYTSVSMETDLALDPPVLKIVGAESQVVTFPHNPSQAEIDNLPDDTLVAVYSSTDVPYVPDN